MKKNLLRRIIGGISLTSAFFVFQACYGTPQDMMPDLLIEGKVKSKTSDLPLKGIKVSVANLDQYQLTDENGDFSFYTMIQPEMTLKFEDVDSSANGLYVNYDTVLTNLVDTVVVDVRLEEK
jgi:hypothetical protein